MFSCQYCADFSVRTFQKLLRHIKFIHSNEPNFCISCGHCGQSFKKFESFKSHLRRKHKEIVDENADNLEEVPPQFDDSREDSTDDEEENDHDIADKNPIEKMTRFIALFILKIKEENQLSQPSVDSILGNTKDLLEQSLQGFKEEVIACLRGNGIDVSQLHGLNDLFQKQSSFSEAVIPVANEYLQVKYFMENFNFVVSRLNHGLNFAKHELCHRKLINIKIIFHFHFQEPVSVVLSQKAEYKLRNGRMKLTHTKETYQYIPILKTLQALLNHPDILEEVLYKIVIVLLILIIRFYNQ